MKKYFLLLVFIVAGFPVFAAIDLGSIAGKGLPLYHLRDGATPGDTVEGVTFDFKAVTVGTKTWVWTKLNGKNLAGNDWSSQFRWWSPVKQEYNLSGVAGTQESHGIVGIPDINFCEPTIPDTNHCVITFLQEEYHGEGHAFHDFYETDNFIYNYTQPNPADANDQIPPVLNTPIVVNQTDRQLRLFLSATDDSENFFYYIKDTVNNFGEISFSDEVVLNLDPDVTYYFSICAVDFSGNQSQSAAIPLSNLPDSIRNGSDFYLIYMDAESETGLGTKVKEKAMFRDYYIWEAGETLEESDRTGVNAWGVSAPWVAFDIAPDATTTGWNRGAIVAKLNEFDQVPKLKALTDNPDDYYFHFAIKSPATQPDAGWTLILYSDSTFGDEGLKYYVGPDTVASARGLPWLGDYEHNGEWQHFEIPVSQLVSKGYKWGDPLSVTDGKVYLIGFQSPANKPGTELNLDAVFFYRKRVVFVTPPS